MRYFLIIASIDKINIYIANIKIYFYHYCIPNIGQKYLIILKSVLYIEKPASC